MKAKAIKVNREQRAPVLFGLTKGRSLPLLPPQSHSERATLRPCGLCLTLLIPPFSSSIEHHFIIWLPGHSISLMSIFGPVFLLLAPSLQCVCAKSCPTHCDSVGYGPPYSSVLGILQARTLEWVAIPFSRGSSQPRDRTKLPAALALASGFVTTEPPGKPTALSLGCCVLSVYWWRKHHFSLNLFPQSRLRV